MNETLISIIGRLGIGETAAAVILFVLGLLALIKGGDWFVDGASGIAHKFNIPEVLIGATIVSIGTTLPEVMVSATSAVKMQGDIAYGNAIGSVVCNTALIAAITVAVRPSQVDSKTFRIPVVFFFASALFYAFNAYFFKGFARWSGIVLLLTFVGYVLLSVKTALKSYELPLKAQKESENENDKMVYGASTLKKIIWLVFGAAMIAVGATLLVDNGTIIATALGVPQSVIALTIVALGTSLPEFVTAISSLIKGHNSLSLGNIVGANFFNIVLVSGLAVSISPFDLPANNLAGGINKSLVMDMPVMFIAMALLTIPTIKREKTSRIQGVALLAIYAAFCTLLFVL